VPGKIRKIIQENPEIKVYLSVFINNFLEKKHICKDCKDELFKYWKEVLKNPEALYR